MKHIKKVLALALALAMVLAMGAFATFAEEQTYSLTIKHGDGIADASDHSYAAYQIITGDISGNEGSYVLSNMKWGTNAMDGKTSGIELTADELAEVKAWTEDSVKSLVPTGNAVATSTKNADGNYVISGLAPGYYIVKDETNLNSQNDANSAVIIQVVGDTTVETKRAIPTVDKQVYDDEEQAWSDAADHDLYESFEFKLTATIPIDADYAAYSAYKVVFHDTMSKGVAFEEIKSVKVGNTTLEASQYTATASARENNGDDNSTWELRIDDIKSIVANLAEGTTVEVIYTAHLTDKVETYYNASATDATPSNNKVYLEYSNNPAATGTGNSVQDTVWVFSYEVNNTKVEPTNDEPITAEAYAELNDEAKKEYVPVGDKYQKVQPLAGAGFKLYQNNTEIALIYDDQLNAYRPVKDNETGTEMTSAQTTGAFNIKGLDAGAYTLKETTTPSGYNTMADQIIEISPTTAENAAGTAADLTMSKADTSNVITNHKGSELPATGGIGTVIFYVVGAALVIGCGIVLISRRRVSNK